MNENPMEERTLKERLSDIKDNLFDLVGYVDDHSKEKYKYDESCKEDVATIDDAINELDARDARTRELEARNAKLVAVVVRAVCSGHSASIAICEIDDALEKLDESPATDSEEEQQKELLSKDMPVIDLCPGESSEDYIRKLREEKDGESPATHSDREVEAHQAGAKIMQLEEENERLRETLDKEKHRADQYEKLADSLGENNNKLRQRLDQLPVYADTGERFVPGKEECWVCRKNGKVYQNPNLEYSHGGWLAPGFESSVFYKYREAAQKAGENNGIPS